MGRWWGDSTDMGIFFSKLKLNLCLNDRYVFHVLQISKRWYVADQKVCSCVVLCVMYLVGHSEQSIYYLI
jgi:hypothetical protein